MAPITTTTSLAYGKVGDHSGITSSVARVLAEFVPMADEPTVRGGPAPGAACRTYQQTRCLGKRLGRAWAPTTLDTRLTGFG
jgi:hypothetical protein